MRKLTHLSIVSLLLVTLTACAEPVLLPNGGFPVLERIWSLSEGGSGNTALVSSFLLTGDTEDKLKIMDLTTRQILWKKDIPIDTGKTSFTEKGDKIFVRFDNNVSQKLLVMSYQGDILNTINLPEHAFYAQSGNSGPSIFGNKLYIAQNTSLYIYDITDSLKKNIQPIWQKTFQNLFAFTLDISGNVYISIKNEQDKGEILSFDTQENLRWQIEAGKLSGFPQVEAHGLLVEGDTLLATASGGQLQGYDIKTGKPKWDKWSNYDTCFGKFASSASNLTVGEEKIFVAPFGGTCVNAFDFKTGRALWIFDSPNMLTFDSQPVYHNGVLYATNNRLWALDAKDGKSLAVSDRDMYGTQFFSIVHYDSIRDQILLWGYEELAAFKPIK